MGRNKGHTLLELLTTIAIFTILCSEAIPSMTSLYEKNNRSANIHLFTSFMGASRSSAIMESTRVVICPSKDGSVCDTGKFWDQGMMAFIDLNHNQEREPQENVLRYTNLKHGVLQSAKDRVQFNALGGGDINSWTYCSAGQPPIQMQKITLSLAGRVRVFPAELHDGQPCNG